MSVRPGAQFASPHVLSPQLQVSLELMMVLSPHLRSPLTVTRVRVTNDFFLYSKSILCISSPYPLLNNGQAKIIYVEAVTTQPIDHLMMAVPNNRPKVAKDN
eukprot:5258037-Amphidinium_carterae.2